PELNDGLTRDGLPPLSIGMGIHAGPYLLGSLGNRQKRYTIVSEAANLAAHIERQTRQHPWPILLSKTVAQLLPPALTREVAMLELEQQAVMPLYTLSGTVGNSWPHLKNA